MADSYQIALDNHYYTTKWSSIKLSLPDEPQEQPLRTTARGNWASGSVQTQVEVWLITITARSASWLKLQHPELMLSDAQDEQALIYSNP